MIGIKIRKTNFKNLFLYSQKMIFMFFVYFFLFFSSEKTENRQKGLF